MGLTPTSYVETPHVAFVRFFIGDELITLDASGKPNNFVSFSLSRGLKHVLSFTLTVIDPEWSRIERILARAAGQQNGQICTFQFGYENAGGVTSRLYTGIVRKASPSFYVDGIQFVIEGSGDIGSSTLRKSSKSYPNPVTNGGVDNYKIISEYVEDIAKRKQWVYSADTIHKTKELKSFHSSDTTEPVNLRFIQNRTDEYTFIRSQLAPRAIRDKDGVAGYVFYIDNVDGSNVCHFHPPDYEKPSARTFIYMREKNSEVLSFSVEVAGEAYLAQLGGLSDVAVPLVDAFTGYYKTLMMNDKNTPEKTNLAGFKQAKRPFVSTPGIQAYSAVMNVPCENEAIAEALARNYYYNGYYVQLNATLVIVGDDNPNIDPGQVVRVLITDINQAPHHTSGNYMITDKSDEIQGGIWTTTLSLTRDGFSGAGTPWVGKKNTK